MGEAQDSGICCILLCSVEEAGVKPAIFCREGLINKLKPTGYVFNLGKMFPMFLRILF